MKYVRKYTGAHANNCITPPSAARHGRARGAEALASRVGARRGLAAGRGVGAQPAGGRRRAHDRRLRLGLRQRQPWAVSFECVI
jgi:hypothetical protein